LTTLRISVSIFFIAILSVLKASDVKSVNFERHFDQTELSAYKADAAFDYTTTYAKSDNWLTLVMIYILSMIAQLFGSTGTGWLIPVFFRIVVVAVLVWLLYYILRQRFGSVFEKTSKSQQMPSTISVNADGKVDFEKFIHESFSKGEYNLAIRYIFLNSIHQLHTQGEIKIAQWKAPFDYLEELKATKKDTFLNLVRIFESTWYGDHDADVEVYNESVNLAKQLAND